MSAWEVSVDGSGAALLRFITGCVETGSHFTRTLRFAAGEPIRHGITVIFITHIPDGAEEQFKAIVKPQDLRAPTHVRIG